MDAVYVARNAVFNMATGTKTVLAIAAGAAQPASVFEFGISFDGVTATAIPATVTLEQITSFGTASAGASPPAIVQSGGRAFTVQATSTHNYTTETGITSNILESIYVPQFMGVLIKQFPLGLEPDTDLSGGTVKGLAIRANVSATVNCLAYIRFGIGG